VTTDHETGEVLMVANMNAEAFAKTIELGEAVYYSRSRKQLWHKGATSGLVQKVREILVDDDQDAVWLRVDVQGGASCHVGYRSCFYRSVPIAPATQGPLDMKFTITEKVFDPQVVYGDAPNPTKL
jgi:phosphoribosyl-AMP cyclohydrolase